MSPCPSYGPHTDLSLIFIPPRMIFLERLHGKVRVRTVKSAQKEEDDTLATLPPKGNDDIQEDQSAKSEAPTQRVKKAVETEKQHANPLASVSTTRAGKAQKCQIRQGF